jgi:hypothetical protein
VGYTVVGIFVHSANADLAAATLMDDFYLSGEQIDILTPSWADDLPRPATDFARAGVQSAGITSFTGAALELTDNDPVAKRWGDLIRAGDWAVVARTHEGDNAEAIAASLREAGAERVDILPH